MVSDHVKVHASMWQRRSEAATHIHTIYTDTHIQTHTYRHTHSQTYKQTGTHTHTYQPERESPEGRESLHQQPLLHYPEALRLSTFFCGKCVRVYMLERMRVCLYVRAHINVHVLTRAHQNHYKTVTDTATRPSRGIDMYNDVR